MTVFDQQRAAVSRTPQALLVLGVRYCGNHYASGNVQNQFLWTEDFSNAAWANFGVTVTTNFYTDPRGGQTADKLGFGLDGDLIQQDGFLVLAASNTFNFSVWLRADSGNQTVTLKLRNTVATIESYSKQVTVGTSWQRVSITATFGASAGGVAIGRLERVAGDATGIIGAWGAQLTKGADLFSYVKATSTRINASTCAAIDRGDGKRCFYSFPTCQDLAHFMTDLGDPSRGIREFRFAFTDSAIGLPGEDVAPYLESFDYAAQRIDPERSVTVSERIAARLFDDAGPGLWDPVKSAEGAKVNTARGAGTFWRRFLSIFKNYANPDGYGIIKSGFVASGMTEALYEQKFRGLIRNIAISARGLCEVTLTDRLKLLKAKIPPKISQTNLLNGAIDNIQTTVVVDDASEITPPGVGYTVTIEVGTISDYATSEKMNVTAISGNTLTVQRGRWGKAAVSRVDNAIFRETVEIGTERTTPSSTPIGKNPIDVVIELLQRGGIAAADIDIAGLQFERDTWLVTTANAATGVETGPTFGGSTIGTITDQIEIEKLINDQFRAPIMLSLWVNEAQKVTGRLFAPARPSETLKEITDSDYIIADSMNVDDNDESRVTRVLVAYDLPSGKTGDKTEDYQRFNLTIGSDEESVNGYGDERQKTILSKFIRPADSATPSRFGHKILARFRNAARNVTLGLESKDDDTKLGDFLMVTSAKMQKADGSADSGRVMQVIKKSRKQRSRIDLELLDTGLFRKYAFVAPAGTPDYGSASTQQRRYAFIGATSTNRVNSGTEDGYFIW